MIGPLLCTVLFSHGPSLAAGAGSSLLNVEGPCVTLSGNTFHWMSLLIGLLFCCCCCSPCLIALSALILQKKEAKPPRQVIDKPPPKQEEQQSLLGSTGNYSYMEIFPQELRRTAEKPVKAAVGVERKESYCSENRIGICYGSSFCILLTIVLLIPLIPWSAFSVFNRVMMDLSYPAPMFIWVAVLLMGLLSGAVIVPHLFMKTASTGATTRVMTYCGSCMGSLIMLSALIGIHGAAGSSPYLARAGNEICRTFENSNTRPKHCTARRLLSGNNISTDISDIDLDEDGLADESRRLGPGHDGAQSYLQRLVMGGSNCVDTGATGRSTAWVVPSYPKTSHLAAKAWAARSSSDGAYCETTTYLCQSGWPADKNFGKHTSCMCNGASVTSTGGLKIGSYCNLWEFGDAEPWCFIDSNALSCGTGTQVEIIQSQKKSTAPCVSGWFKQYVVARSKALSTGVIQYGVFLGFAVLLALLSCSAVCAAQRMNRIPREKRYHADNGLAWIMLEEAKPMHAKMWQVLGWNATNWDSSDPKLYPRSERKTWAQLSRTGPPGSVTEQQAASGLGFNQSTWDGEMLNEAHKFATRGGGDVEDQTVNQGLADRFCAWQEEASTRITQETPDLKRLELYGFYHQAMQGNLNGVRPAAANKDAEFEQQKWDAWYRLNGMSRQTAMEKYIEAVKEMPLPNGSAGTNQQSWQKQ